MTLSTAERLEALEASHARLEHAIAELTGSVMHIIMHTGRGVPALRAVLDNVEQRHASDNRRSELEAELARITAEKVR